MDRILGAEAAHVLETAVGRRNLFRVASVVGGTAAAATLAGCVTPQQENSPSAPASAASAAILQPNSGDITGDHYLAAEPDKVLWGYVPTVHSDAAVQMKSGQTVTIDALSHEGILEDQGRDPLAYFGSKGVAEADVLQDAIDVAANYNRTTRNFDADGPHVVVGPVFVEGAKPGDVLKIETLEAIPRVPYGVVSSRHGKGALAMTKEGGAPAGLDLSELMPPASTDGRKSGAPVDYGNVSTFTAIRDGQGIMPFTGGEVQFPLRPFMGMMGVAYADDQGLTSANANSIPPTLGGGNIDIRLLGVGSTFYLPVFADGALFYVGDPHMAMGDGEVALTAMEGSLRGTFRLTVCKPGSGDAPTVAYKYPFGETDESWIPVGLSDPDGAKDGQGSDLDIAMRRAVVNALDFLEQDRGMDRATAYAYLSAAADFVVSQVVDRTVGVHGQIYKSHFA